MSVFKLDPTAKTEDLRYALETRLSQMKNLVDFASFVNENDCDLTKDYKYICWLLGDLVHECQELHAEIARRAVKGPALAAVQTA